MYNKPYRCPNVGGIEFCVLAHICQPDDILLLLVCTSVQGLCSSTDIERAIALSYVWSVKIRQQPLCCESQNLRYCLVRQLPSHVMHCFEIQNFWITHASFSNDPEVFRKAVRKVSFVNSILQIPAMQSCHSMRVRQMLSQAQGKHTMVLAPSQITMEPRARWLKLLISHNSSSNPHRALTLAQHLHRQGPALSKELLRLPRLCQPL